MMDAKIVKATLRYYRHSPLRMREVADLVRGKSAEEAQSILEFTNRKAAGVIKKLLDSAIANAENNFGMDVDILFLKTCLIDEGPKLKRFMFRV